MNLFNQYFVPGKDLLIIQFESVNVAQFFLDSGSLFHFEGPKEKSRFEQQLF